ncbi:MAG: ribonuclease R [Chitinophagales bacterium]|nr:ribonuclease R [Chitinophagales bacterium]MCZ2394320.1 ribonuclease R [Chitinophagales bacterium]
MSKKKQTDKQEKKTDARSSILKYLRDLDKNKAVSEGQISRKLSVQFSKSVIIKTLFNMTAEGLLSMSDGNKFKLKIAAHSHGKSAVNEGEEVIGILDVTKNGSAYLIPENGGKDIFILERHLKKSFNKDKVKVQITSGSKNRPEGKVVDIIERHRTIFIGRLDKKKYSFVRIEDSSMNVDFYIADDKLNGAQNGDKVVVQLLDWPDRAKNPFGKITEVLGRAGDNDVEMKSLLIENGFYLHFSKEALKEAEKIKVEIPKSEIAKRRDFRSITTFTIDPLDAKDFDDALSVQLLGNDRWEIGVHIADVSHYVLEGSALDRDAYKRATSVYLADRVAPMLPEQLSNIICSLRPDEEKCCFSAVFEMDTNGSVYNQWFGRTIIRSNRRYVYEEAQEVLDGKEDEFADELKLLNTIAKKLKAKRIEEGSLILDSQELRFQLDASGKPIGVIVKERKDAHMLVEDFMLLANKHVAQFVGQDKNKQGAKPFVYRIHDDPDQEKLKDFGLFAARFGYKLNLDNPKKISKELNRLMEEVEGHPEQSLLQQLAIRCMAKAIYSTENIGHYGLGFEYYTHFTSPIRRYPDVMVHRLLQNILDQKPMPKKAELELQCKHSSERERAAMDAERDSVKFKMIEFMECRIGEVFRGVVSGVKSWGVYVELPEYNTEGMIRLDSFGDDKYVVDEKNMLIKGIFTDKKYYLGDEIYVKLSFVDKRKKTIDFELSTKDELLHTENID